VRIHADFRPRETRAVDQARMVELVGDEEIALARERRKAAQIRVIAGREEQHIGAEKFPQLFLELRVRLQISDDQSRRARARAIARFGIARRIDHVWMRGQRQVIVAADVEDRSSVDDCFRPLCRRHDTQRPLETGFTQPAQLLADVVENGGH